MSAEESWVEVQGYDARWPQIYVYEASKVKKALGDYAVGLEHFGSTAVPGLAAKPIVDILVGTRDSGVTETMLASLSALDYEFLGEDGRRPGRFFFRKRGKEAFNLSIVPFGGDLWAENIRIRDFLRNHPEWAQRYATLKRQAAVASPESLLGYQDRKRDFMDEMKQEAQAWMKRQ
jgi:GrpB-like predicted nucleotidyltransferase (UPF0157 family)